MLEAVPHLVGGMERAQSSLLAGGVLIAGPVPAADHRLRGEAVHVCDHPLLRPDPHPPQHKPSPALSRTKAPNSSSSLHDPLSLSVDNHLRWWDGGVTVKGVCRRPPPPAPKPSIGLPLSFWEDGTEVSKPTGDPIPLLSPPLSPPTVFVLPLPLSGDPIDLH